MKLETWPLHAVLVLTAMLWNPFLTARGQGIFGNSPTGGAAFDFVANGGIAGGGAVGFTPNRDFTIGSVTVWLTGYTGLDMYGNQNQSFYAGIYLNQELAELDYTNNQPGTLVTDLVAPAPNDGSLSAFIFENTSPTTILNAGKQYWLFIYEATSGSYNFDAYPQWVQGDTPTGDAVYDGAQNFWAFTFSPSSATPAFEFNPVPEPGTEATLAAGLMMWGICWFRFIRQSSQGKYGDPKTIHPIQARQHFWLAARR